MVETNGATTPIDVTEALAALPHLEDELRARRQAEIDDKIAELEKQRTAARTDDRSMLVRLRVVGLLNNTLSDEEKDPAETFGLATTLKEISEGDGTIPEDVVAVAQSRQQRAYETLEALAETGIALDPRWKGLILASDEKAPLAVLASPGAPNSRVTKPIDVSLYDTPVESQQIIKPALTTREAVLAAAEHGFGEHGLIIGEEAVLAYAETVLNEDLQNPKTPSQDPDSERWEVGTKPYSTFLETFATASTRAPKLWEKLVAIPAAQKVLQHDQQLILDEFTAQIEEQIENSSFKVVNFSGDDPWIEPNASNTAYAALQRLSYEAEVCGLGADRLYAVIDEKFDAVFAEVLAREEKELEALRAKKLGDIAIAQAATKTQIQSQKL